MQWASWFDSLEGRSWGWLVAVASTLLELGPLFLCAGLTWDPIRGIRGMSQDIMGCHMNRNRHQPSLRGR